MKVLIVHHQMALYGGAELVVVRLAHYLQEQGHKVSILAASTAQHNDYEGLDIITPPKEVNWHLWNGTISSLREIYGVLMSLHKLCNRYANSFDVINTHNFPTTWTVPNKKKVVWMCNEVPDLWHNEHVPVLLNQVLNTGRLIDRAIVRSKQLTAVVPDSRCAQRFRHRYGLIPKVIPYGIDGKFFSQQVDAEKSSKFCIIQPSMISPSKGQLEVLDAVRSLDARVIFAGYYEPRHPYTLKLFLDSRGRDITFTGHINKEGLRELYNTAHVAVFPGKGQGSWLGPFEALASGCPIIVSPNLSCSALIKQHQLGIVTFDIGSAFREIQCNYPKYQQQALRGRELVLDKLTWSNFGARMLELMEK